MLDSLDSQAHLTAKTLLDFAWKPQPKAEAWLSGVLAKAYENLPWTTAFAAKLHREAAVRFADLLDTVFLGETSEWIPSAKEAGWQECETGSPKDGLVATYRHPGGLFPNIAVRSTAAADEIELMIQVEFVADFLGMNDLSRPIVGTPWAPFRYADIEVVSGKAKFAICERHGYDGYGTTLGPEIRDVLEVYEAFLTRRRDFTTEEEALRHTAELIDVGIAKIGRDYACDRFFASERDYWQKRNRAAQFQRARQDKLGIGWANHDHHTYRSSRKYFQPLVALWEKLGLECRERFYAGIEAGWGAQVMEHPVTGIITFNDVDLSPEELACDFSHDGLEEKNELRTIGLWCGLHGEAVTLAGMHHLEGTFDFVSLRDQLEAHAGIRTMKPFTDFSYLRQAFTEGERWPVQEKRIQSLVDRGLITMQQAETFRREGAIGSHLENLERNEGFKGFNQKGVSEIIAATDPRRQSDQNAFERIQYKTIGDKEAR